MLLLMHQHMAHAPLPSMSDHIRWSVDIRFQDSRLTTKAGTTKAGFTARSEERSQDVMAEYEGFIRIQEALIEFQAAEAGFQQKTGVRLKTCHTWLLNERVGLSCRLLDIFQSDLRGDGSYQEIAYRDFADLGAQAIGVPAVDAELFLHPEE